jgi:CRP-like cAMP-binding protein
MSKRASSHAPAQRAASQAVRRRASRSLSMTERVEVLARAPLFASLTRSALRSITGAFHERLCTRGETLFEQGDAADEFFVVARGELAVLTAGKQAAIVNRLGPGEHLGEIALLTGSPRTATVTAARPALLLVLGAEDFHTLIESNATVLAHIARALSTRSPGAACSRSS